jgi:hypothetical protein
MIRKIRRDVVNETLHSLTIDDVFAPVKVIALTITVTEKQAQGQ